MERKFPDCLVEVDLAAWIAACPAQRFVKPEGDSEKLFIIPDEVYHSPEYQAELLEAIGEHNAVCNTAPNGHVGDTEPLTLEKLTAMMKAMPKFPRYPPHYRCNQETFDLMRSYMVEGEPSVLKTVVSGCTIVINQKVPVGEFWPPEGWEP